MTKLALIKVFVLIFLHTSTYGQKIKYKEVWELLNNKQYQSAEPYLKSYLKENNDNANALLYMGILYHDKSMRDDVLKQTKRAVAHIDSAVMYYEKAQREVSEKEIKRNEEYYQYYNRRDLRTGEFGVKLSDIQYDLEKKIQGLRERRDNLIMVKHYFNLADSLYKDCNTQYKNLQQTYPSDKEFYLRADENTVKQLASLASKFDSCESAFEHYKSASSTLGKTGYTQSFKKNEIRNFKKDGSSIANFLINDLQVWDYKSFALKASSTIQKEILPLQDHLIAVDMQINKLRDRLNKERVSVKDDLYKLTEKLEADKLRKFDADPLPIKVLNLKIADLEYKSLALENKALKDTTNLLNRFAQVESEYKNISRIDSLSEQMLSEKLEEEAADYSFFVTNTYSNTKVLRSFVRAMKDYAIRERNLKGELLAKRREALRWIITSADSVPLFYDSINIQYKPLIIVEEKYTAGLHNEDSVLLKGYFYDITPTRKSNINVSFPVDEINFSRAHLANTHGIAYADPDGQVYFVLFYSDQPTQENKYPVTLAKIYRADGLAWSANYSLSFIPQELIYNADLSEVAIAGDDKILVLDKNGKVIRNSIADSK